MPSDVKPRYTSHEWGEDEAKSWDTKVYLADDYERVEAELRGKTIMASLLAPLTRKAEKLESERDALSLALSEVCEERDEYHADVARVEAMVLGQQRFMQALKTGYGYLAAVIGGETITLDEMLTEETTNAGEQQKGDKNG